MEHNYFLICKDVIQRIILEELPFRVALESEGKKHKLEASDRALISAIVGAELRHHLLFSYLVDAKYIEKSFEEKATLYILLSNQLFAKKINEKEILAAAMDYLKSIDSELSISMVKDFLLDNNDVSNLIKDEQDHNSLKYLSLRYNTPIWLIKMWQKHYGKGLTRHILKANTHLPLSVMRVNTLQNDENSLLDDYHHFSKSPLKNMVFYIAKEPLRKNERYLKGDIFPSNLALKYLLDDFDIYPYEDIAIYQGVNGENLFLEVALKASLEMKCELMFRSGKDYVEYHKVLERFDLSKTMFTQIKGEFVTHISKKVNVFFLYAESSSFQNIRTSPDYLLHFKQESLDQHIQREKALLNDAKDYVEEDGKLIYIVNTLSKKESVNIINEFLKENPNFMLDTQKQFFPCDDFNSTLYYAILRRKGDLQSD